MRKVLFILLFIAVFFIGCSTNNQNENTLENKDNEQSDVNEANNNDNDTNSEESIEALLKEMTEDFFVAQRNRDIDEMKYHLASSATYDEAADVFFFDDITYPHEMERFSIKEENLDYRYIHLDVDFVTINYAAVNYEEEYSFVIDFMWVQEAGQWKIKDMEMNK